MKHRYLVITVLLVLAVAPAAARAEWTKQNTNSFAWFKDIFFVNAVLLSTEDGGQTWVQARKFTTDSILQVHFETEMTGWLLCERNVFAGGKEPTSYLRRTTDGGRT